MKGFIPFFSVMYLAILMVFWFIDAARRNDIGTMDALFIWAAIFIILELFGSEGKGD